MNRAAGLLALSTLLSACQPEEPVEEVFSGCDPLDEGRCSLPHPSSYFQVADDTTVTGVRLRYWDGSDCDSYSPGIGEASHPIFSEDVDGVESEDPCTNSLPVNVDGVAVKPHFLNERDGFSPAGTLLTYFDDANIDGVIHHTDLEAYLADDVKTVILDEEGNRIPHWVELDMTTVEENRRLLQLRPVVPLDFDTTYTVGIRGLTKNAGGPVDVSDGFAWLRDGDDWAKLDRDNPPPRHWDIESRREHYETTVFPLLEGTGFARDELQLAWDFHTASREGVVGKLEHMRDDMLGTLPADGPTYEITNVEINECTEGQTIGKTVYADLTVPLYTELDGPGTFLTRGADGMPERNGTTKTEIMVRIPCSVINDPEPVRILQYGHGLLGDKGEARTGWLSTLANERKFIVFAMDWRGMAEVDVPDITLMLVSDISAFPLLPERAHQGINEWVAGAKAMQGAFGEDEAFIIDGTPIIDPDDIVYWGNSQGGIMGGAYMALSPDVQRGVLGVPGGPYNLLLTRSNDFDPFFLVFKTKFDDHRDINLGIALMQIPWDAAESSGWMTSMNGPDLPAGHLSKEILLHVGIGDAQVTPLGAHIMARAYGAKTVAPQTRPIFGVEEGTPPFTGSAIVEWEYDDVPEVPDTNIPPESNDFDTHECPRREPGAQEQAWHWFNTGEITQQCDGEGGACIYESSEWCR